jgi:hypothetical protein
VTRAVRPLAARLYLLRNPRRVLPAIVVQALVTALVLAVVTPLTGFTATAERSIAPLKAYTGLEPMRRKDFDAELTRLVEANPAMEKHIEAKAIWMRMPMVVGESGTLLMALDAAEREEFLRRVGNRVVQGTLPEAGSNGVAIHRDVALARGMGIGNAFGQLIDPEEPTPGLFRVDAIVDGPSRVGLADLAHANDPDSVLSRRESFRVVYAKAGRKAESDAYLHAAKDPEGRTAFKVWDEAFIRKLTQRWTKNLPLVLNAIVGAMTVIVGFIVILLNLISFQARHDEFALWIALGHTRGRLVRKLVVESAAQATAAWALGFALGFGFVALYDAWVLAPKAIFIDYLGAYPIVLASALPLLASAASAVALAFRLRRMDPVAVIQRRNA